MCRRDRVDVPAGGGVRVQGLVHGFDKWCDIWIRSDWRVQRHVDGRRARVLPPQGGTPFCGDEDECLAIATSRAPAMRCKRGVVLLHGILNYRGIMDTMAGALQDAGWAVANVGYPSTRLTIEAHAQAASSAARGLAEDGAKEVAFIAHSLGGLIARAAIARASVDGWQTGSLVLVGSPARGSAVATLLSRLPGYKRLLGGGGVAITPQGAGAIPIPRTAKIAVIAGGNGARGFSPLLQGDNDATVTVSETRLPDVEDAFLLVHARHNPLMIHRTTCAAALAFLQTGRLCA